MLIAPRLPPTRRTSTLALPPSATCTAPGTNSTCPLGADWALKTRFTPVCPAPNSSSVMSTRVSGCMSTW